MNKFDFHMAVDSLPADLSPTTLPDAMVVSRVLDGEKSLFEILLRRYNQTLFRVVRSYLQDETEVEDTMQDTYLKAYRKLHQFHGQAAFSTWLIRIGINEALQRIRKAKRAPFTETNGTDPEPNGVSHSDPQAMNPEEQFIQEEARSLLESAIDQLAEKYRSVYMLREVEGLDTAEVAACLDISLSNTKVRLHRAKILLKEKLYQLSAAKSGFEFGNSRCDRLVEKVMRLI